MSISLLINSFINDELKYNHFKITFKEIYEIFDSIHIKIRGAYKNKCIEYAKLNCQEKKLFTYQLLGENDWHKTTLRMVKNIQTKNIFLYNEDHKLNCSLSSLKAVFNQFNKFEIDFMTYSFFKASKLNSNNILPLNPIQKSCINYFNIDNNKLKLIGKISPNYYYISLIGIFSKNYIYDILNKENFKYKIYIPFLSKVVSRFLGNSRKLLFRQLNYIFNKFNSNICLYPINSPFNFEKIWFENYDFLNSRKYGISKKELFINFDDDNGMYSESLIKRGLYPFDDKYFLTHLKNRKDLLSSFKVYLKRGEVYDCTYFNTLSRINNCPMLKIKIIHGELDIKTNNDNLIKKYDKYIYLYANLSPKLLALKDSKIRISIFDEIAK
tara:strand:- start:106 stop:1254 length:1149 start_codon:yes stop_codon:yes gene_type:complete